MFIFYVYYSFEYKGTKYDMKGYQDSFKSFCNTSHAILKKYFNNLKKISTKIYSFDIIR